MDWVNVLLLLLGLLVLTRLIILIRKTSQSKKHTIQLEERPPSQQANPNLSGLILIFMLLLMLVAVAAQFLFGRVP